MRARTLLVTAAATIAMAAQAWAGPVSLAPTRFSDDLQETLAEDYGAREGVYLEERLDRALSRALGRVGHHVAQGAPLSIETTIVDARPNRPTFQQLIDEPSLDFGRSISTGGAELVAVIRGPDGQQLGEVRHRYFTSTLQEVHPAGTWNDADRSINWFARRVAEEYARIAR